MKALFVVLVLALVGCHASPFFIMVNPKDGTSAECSGVGTLAYASAVQDRVDNCVRQYEGLGYVKADSLTPEQRARVKIQPPEIQHRVVLTPNH